MPTHNKDNQHTANSTQCSTDHVSFVPAIYILDLIGAGTVEVVVVTTGSIKLAKLQSNSHHQ